jgi:hypothetical protein
VREGEGKGERIGKADDEVTGYGLLTETIFAKTQMVIEYKSLRTAEPRERNPNERMLGRRTTGVGAHKVAARQLTSEREESK